MLKKSLRALERERLKFKSDKDANGLDYITVVRVSDNFYNVV